MATRIDYTNNPLYRKYLDFHMALQDSAIDELTRELVALRASQVNGCAFCVDMHVKKATLLGERPLRLHHVAIWRESTLFTARERAAFAWTEILTTLPQHGVPDAAFAQARAQFPEQELTDLTFAIMAINGWNRISIAYAVEPGSQDKVYGLLGANLG